MSETPTPYRAQSKKDLLLEKKRAIEQELRALAMKETTARRKAETRGKIILGGLVLSDAALVAKLATQASDRDREHLTALGWLPTTSTTQTL